MRANVCGYSSLVCHLGTHKRDVQHVGQRRCLQGMLRREEWVKLYLQTTPGKKGGTRRCSAFIATTHAPELSGSAFVQENSSGVRLFHSLSVYVRIAQIIEQC